ncbi:MAG TPA: Spy/CpxP family protein refolding chaperone [Chitinophagaceae bacterium]|jgi:Spy/CpxP family protein refolding chaperone|nr:Spy/CpxP family protein refolding chaperone [Chitinophagaceae bacterium]
MNTGTKNKLLITLVVALLLANTATIIMFWSGKKTGPLLKPGGAPKEFLVKELKLDQKQQEQLDALVKEHRASAEQLRKKTREAKEAFFDLLKQQGVPDSIKQVAAKAVSVNTEELDLLTFAHFQKIRALCTAEQQQKFDEIIHEVTRMMAQPGRPMGAGHPQGPPPDGPGGNGPPPGE